MENAGVVGEVLYRNAPLVETSLGVGFSPIQGWNVQHFGLYYDLVRAKYSQFDTASPIVLSRPTANAPMFLPFSKIRAFYSNGDRTRLIQTQDDLFFVNWQKMVTEATYPRYVALKAAFDNEWRTFGAFLSQHELKLPLISRHQISYVNVIERAKPAGEALGIDEIFSGWRCGDGPIARTNTEVTLSAAYQIDDIDLVYSLQSALRVTDQTPVYQFTITSGKTFASAGEMDLALMDRLHDTLIEAFEEFTSERAKVMWGKF